MMQKAIEERGHGRGVAEQLAPVVHGPVSVPRASVFSVSGSVTSVSLGCCGSQS